MYFQIGNMGSNFYVLTNELMSSNKSLQLNYLYYDDLEDSFKPRYSQFMLINPVHIQNFNEDYQANFIHRDKLSVYYPIQKYVVLYTKNYMKVIEETWKNVQPKSNPREKSALNKIKEELAMEHYKFFTEYINFPGLDKDSNKNSIRIVICPLFVIYPFCYCFHHNFIEQGD